MAVRIIDLRYQMKESLGFVIGQCLCISCLTKLRLNIDQYDVKCKATFKIKRLQRLNLVEAVNFCFKLMIMTHMVSLYRDKARSLQ